MDDFKIIDNADNSEANADNSEVNATIAEVNADDREVNATTAEDDELLRSTEAELDASLENYVPLSGVDEVATENLDEHLKECVLSGNNALRQTLVHSSLSVDDEWVVVIENAMHSVENIVKNPKSFIKENRELVTIEKIKRVDGVAIRHLASHTQNVRRIDEDGMVEPSKMYAGTWDLDICIYENRFVYTLVGRLNTFLEEKYKAIAARMSKYDVTRMDMKTEFEVGKSTLSGELKLTVNTPTEAKADYENNRRILSRLEVLKKRVAILYKTEFMDVLKETKPLRPPINKTNVLMRNIEYNNCYRLWLFISSFTELGYTAEISEKNLPFDDAYYEDMTEVIVNALKVMAENNRLRKAIYDDVEFKNKKRKQFRSLSKVEIATPRLEQGLLNVDDTINQFYFEKMQELVKGVSGRSRANEFYDIENIDTNFRKFYKGLQKLNLELFKEMLNLEERGATKGRNPVEKKANQVKKQADAVKKFKLMTRLKKDDLKLAEARETAQVEKLKKLEHELRQKQKQAEFQKLRKETALRKKRELAQKRKERARLAKEKARLKAQKEREKARAARELAKAKAVEQRQIKQSAKAAKANQTSTDTQANKNNQAK